MTTETMIWRNDKMADYVDAIKHRGRREYAQRYAAWLRAGADGDEPAVKGITAATAKTTATDLMNIYTDPSGLERPGTVGNGPDLDAEISRAFGDFMTRNLSV